MQERRGTESAGRRMIGALALAQFIASYAATNMNVAISDIAQDLGATVADIQTTITLFTLTMASLMMAGSKLTGIFGRKTCFIAGLVVYGTGALLAALAPGVGLLTFAYSFLEGVGSALMIPPIYILITMSFPDVESRARRFGAVSGAGALGAAAGPLIGGLLTSALSWRAAFLVQVLVVVWIIVLARSITDPRPPDRSAGFDVLGALLSMAGLFCVVFGILRFGDGGWLFIVAGALVLAVFFWHIRARERRGREPLIPMRLFRDKTSNLGLVTQNVQWLTMQGTFFVISVYLQQALHYNAIQTGLTLTPATAGILIASALAERFAGRHPQRRLIQAGFAATAAGMVLLLVLGGTSFLSFVPGLLLIGLGVGTMLTASVNVVQSSFPEAQQDEISGLSRSVSNLGSSLGTALAGTLLLSGGLGGERPFARTVSVLVLITLSGLAAALFLPRESHPPGMRRRPRSSGDL